MHSIEMGPCEMTDLSGKELFFNLLYFKAGTCLPVELQTWNHKNKFMYHEPDFKKTKTKNTLPLLNGSL